MSNYSGETSFEFEIERYKDRESGKLLTIDKVVDDTEGFEFEYHVINLTVEGRSYFQSGRISGPPEDCCPDEGETEIVSVLGPEQEDWRDKLTPAEESAILESIESNVQDKLDFDPDDYYDDRDY